VEGVTLVGLKLQVAPLGRPEQLKVTVELKPLNGVTVSVVVPLCPAWIVSEEGFAVIVKLGWGGDVTVMVVPAETDAAKLPLAA